MKYLIELDKEELVRYLAPMLSKELAKDWTFVRETMEKGEYTQEEVEKLIRMNTYMEPVWSLGHMHEGGNHVCEHMVEVRKKATEIVEKYWG